MVGTRRTLRDQGYYVEGLPPFGYRRSLPKGSRGPEKNVLAIEEREAELVRRAFRMCIAGNPLAKIGDALVLTKDRVRDILRSRVYLGEIQEHERTLDQGEASADHRRDHVHPRPVRAGRSSAAWPWTE